MFRGATAFLTLMLAPLRPPFAHARSADSFHHGKTLMIVAGSALSGSHHPWGRGAIRDAGRSSMPGRLLAAPQNTPDAGTLARVRKAMR